MKSDKLKSAILLDGVMRIKLIFSFDKETINAIKTSFPIRRYNKKDPSDIHWTVPLTVNNCFVLHKIGFKFDAALKDWVNANYANQKIKLEIKGLQGVLKPYQNKGVILIDRFQGCALLADDMGLGKTIQAIAWLQLHPDLRPAIILCPAFLKMNWETEINKWMPEPNAQVIYGTKTDIPLTGDIIIINYQILTNKYEDTGKIDLRNNKPIMRELPHTGWVDYLIDLDPQAIFADEAHYMKNNNAKLTKASFKLAKKIPNRIPMTGTPIENKTIDLYNAVRFANPTLFTNKWNFSHRYCDPKNNGYGWTFNGATNTKELNEILRKQVMIRRLKKDVLKELPPKVYSFIPFKIDNRKEYEKAEYQFTQYVRDGVEIEMRQLLAVVIKNDLDVPIEINDYKLARLKDAKEAMATPLVQIGVLKQLATKGILKDVIKWTENFLESGEKLALFCEHLFVIKAITDHFGKACVHIDGGVSIPKRNKAVVAFQTNKKVRLFIGNKAAQEGLTLTAASNVGIIEYPWNPGSLAQRVDRLHRITQKYTVNVHYMMPVNTIVEYIAEELDRKSRNITSVLDGGEIDEEALLTTLMDSFKTK